MRYAWLVMAGLLMLPFVGWFVCVWAYLGFGVVLLPNAADWSLCLVAALFSMTGGFAMIGAAHNMRENEV